MKGPRLLEQFIPKGVNTGSLMVLSASALLGSSRHCVLRSRQPAGLYRVACNTFPPLVPC